MGYTTSVRFLYFGLPLGAEVLRRRGFVPRAACFGHRMAGMRRARRVLATHALPTDVPGASERPLLLFKPNLADPVVVRALASTRPDAILAWFWPQRIPEAVLALAPRGAFGVHPSLLPRHRGPDPYFHAIREGDAETGVTLHRLEAEYDTGRVVMQRRVPIRPEENAWQLARRLDRPSLELLVTCAARLAAGDALEGAPQDEALATQAEQPDEETLCIDWDADAEEVARLVRAAAPAPMASTLLGDALVFVVRAQVYEGPLPGGLLPGEAARTAEGIVVQAGRGAVLLVEVEDEAGARHRGVAIDRLVPSA